MLKRILEPEVMDTAEDAIDYDAMDHSGVNRIFAEDFFLTKPNLVGLVLDVGTGTAQIPIELCKQSPAIKLLAIDLADSMLAIAAKNVAKAGLTDRIQLKKEGASGLSFAAGTFASVVSNSIVHHIPNPKPCLAEMVRVCMPGGTVFVRDLFRPDSIEELQAIVQRYAGNDNAHQRQLFADSLHAALTLEEVRDIVAGLGFDPATVIATSDRHWTWHAVKPV